MTWLNPCDERNWEYIVDIAKEAIELPLMRFNLIMYVSLMVPEVKWTWKPICETRSY